VLLKHLEHFEGILFLTTNRVETIDSAFQSRIHLSISYPPLSIEYKRKLWEDGLERSNGKRPRWLTAKLLDGWARSQVNGREIQNIIRMAHALAFNEKRPMKISDVQSGVDALELFNADRMEGSTGQRRVREEQEVNGRPKRRRLMG
jgi:hypothetical protein